MSDEEEPAPCAPVPENEHDDAGSNGEQAFMTEKRRKTDVTECGDEYAVSQQCETLSAKANTGKFLGLRAEKPAKPISSKTAKHDGKDFVYGVLFVMLMAFGAGKPLNHTAEWFYCCTLDCKYFYDLTGTDGKDRSKKRQFTDIFRTTLFARTKTTDVLSKTSRPNVSQRLLLEPSSRLATRRATIRF